MATKHITGDRTRMVKALESDTLYVLDKDASITINNKPSFGIFSVTEEASQNRDFRILGDITINEGMGVAILAGPGSEGGDLLVGKSSTIDVNTGTAILNAVEDMHFVNMGRLYGTNGLKSSGDDTVVQNGGLIKGFALGVELLGENSRLVNDGRVLSGGIGVDMGFHGGTLINNGKIFAGDNAVDALITGAETLRIVNNGTIAANDDAISLGNLVGARTVLINRGDITGGDYSIIGNFSIATEIVRNTGNITGRIWLGDGNDVYDGRGGTAGDVSGGNQDDLYIISDTATLLWEAANEGVDTVKATITYTLKDNFENLTLLGANGLTGKGNDSANVITGNTGSNVLYGYDGVDVLNGGKGDDFLYGGFKADTFVFSSGSGHDKAMDFANGVDVIDLRGVANIDDYADIQAAAKTVGADLVLTFAAGETLTVAGFNINSMSQDDFMF